MPVILSIADTTLAVIKEKAGGYFYTQINNARRLEMKIKYSSLTPPAVSAGRRGGGGHRVSCPFLVLHGCGTGRAHIRLYYGHWEPAFPVPCVLVRSKCRQCV